MAEEIIFKQGKVIEAGSNKPFLLDDPDTVFFIEQGGVNLFWVPLVKGEPAGAHNHLFKAEAGEFLFGLSVPPGEGTGFLAVGVSGTRLRILKRKELIKEAQTKSGAEKIIPLVERWIERLSDGISAGTIFPKGILQLEPDQQIKLEQGKTACSKRGTLWLSALSGGAVFFGNKDLTSNGDKTFFPLSGDVWFETSKEIEFKCLNTAKALKDDKEWKALDGFHRFILKNIRLEKEEEHQVERKRFELREEADSLSVQNAFSQLASVVQEQKKGIPLVEKTPYPVLAASRLVGEALNLTIKEHPDFRKKGEQKDALRKIALASRVRVRQVMLTGNWWKQDNGPLVATLTEGNQPVALLPASPVSYEMVNPADESRVKITAENQDMLTGIAHTFYRPFPQKEITFKDLMRFIFPRVKRDLWMMVLLGIAIGLLALIMPVATGKIFNDIIPGAERMQLLELTIAMITAALATAAFTISRGISIQRMMGKFDAEVQAGIWDRVIDLPAPFFREYSAGDLAQRALGINMITGILSITTITAILGGIFGLFNIALLFYYSVKLALVAVVLVVLTLVAFYFATHYQLKYQRPLNDLQGKIAGMVLQFISNGIAKLRVAAAEDRAFARWAAPFTEQKKYAFKARVVSNWTTVFQAVYPLFCTFVIFIFVAYWSFKGKSEAGSAIIPTLSTGDFLAFNNAFSNFMTAALMMGITFIQILMIGPIYQRVKPIFNTLPEVDEAKSDPGELTGNIEVKNIFFRYKEDGPLILKDVSFEAKEGEFIALVGPSGSGKSTLMRLLLGFEQPESGSIFFDGQELAGLDVRTVRRQMGVVLQNGKLLSGSIHENIVGSAPLTQADSWEALKMAGLENDIREMPMQLFTMISEGGSTLSGGQRQRLMIARSIVNKPRIIIFDEATSALDNRTQEIVSESLEKLKATRIVIAHRLSTIQHADRIYVIVNGEVKQVGNFEELVAQAGPFQKLVKRQLA